jgi:hypothetical protein
MKIKHAMSCLVLALSVLAPHSSFAEDLYKGTAEELAFIEKLKTMSRARLHVESVGKKTAIGLACGLSGVVVAASGAVETVPVIGLVPKIISNIPEEHVANSEADGWDVGGMMLGGGISAALSTIDIPIQLLWEGKFDEPYKLTAAAYSGTGLIATQLFSRKSGCRKAIDQLRDVKAEFASRDHQIHEWKVVEGANIIKSAAPAELPAEPARPGVGERAVK